MSFARTNRHRWLMTVAVALPVAALLMPAGQGRVATAGPDTSGAAVMAVDPMEGPAAEPDWHCCRFYPFPIWGCRGPGMTPGTPPPPPPTPGAAAAATYRICPNVAARIPPSVQAFALANPHAIEGYGLRLNPSVPESPWNRLRTWLTLRDIGKPWSECNTVVWKSGCP